MDALKIAETLSKSSLIPEAFRGKPGDVLIALQMGAEVGLSPMQALQGIAVINGRPSIWGDAALALVRAHPSIVSIQEEITGTAETLVATCTVTRVKRGREETTKRTFSKYDAAQAGLWGGKDPWKKYPQRMLQMRARGFAIRDAAADILKGLAFGEEQADIEPVNVTPTISVSKASSVGDQLAQIAAKVTPPAEAPSADESTGGGSDEEELPDFAAMKSADVGTFMVDTARAIGLSPAGLKEIIADFGALTKASAPAIYRRLKQLATTDGISRAAETEAVDTAAEGDGVQESLL